MKISIIALVSGMILLVQPFTAQAKSGDDISRGQISAITASGVTVGSLSCPTNGGTEYEDISGNSIPRSRFSVGDVVKLVCRNGSAHSLEMEHDNGGGSSSNNNGGGGGSDTKLKGRLSAIDGVATSAVGKVEYRNKPNAAGRDDRFKITVKIPVPSSVPVAGNYIEARSLDLTAKLSRDGTAYAECTLGYDHRTLVKGVVAAEHKIELRYEQKGSNLRLKHSKGRCSSIVNAVQIQSDFPEILAGDTVVIEDSLAGEILSGQL